MNYNYQTKFKARYPLETCNIITKFFNDRGFTFNIAPIKTEVGTYSHEIELFYDNKYVGHSSGKGMSEEYSLASGLAELYENFCNYGLIENYLNMHKFWEINNNYGKDIKLLTYDDVLSHNFLKETLLDHVCSGNLDRFKRVANYIMYYNAVGLPYSHLNTSEISYINPLLCIFAEHSNGMSAGNTREEAIIQGISEICERMVMKEFYKSDKQWKIIPHKLITNSELSYLIKKIEDTNKKVYILDLSDYYNTPVVGTIILDLKLCRSYIRFGCFPVFDIALERCLTETYQGIYSLSYHDRSNLQTPFKHQSTVDLNVSNWFWNRDAQHCIDENKLLNAIEIDTISTIFCNNATGTDQLYKYWQNIALKNNWNFFIRDVSLIDEMSSVHIVFDNFALIETMYDDEYYRHLNWDKIFEIADNELELVRLIVTDPFEASLNYKALDHYKQYQNEFNFVNSWLFQGDPSRLFDGGGLCTFNEMKFNNLLNGNTIEVQQFNEFHIDQLIKYTLINRYNHFGHYSYEEIRDILKAFNIEITKSDYDNCENEGYLISKIYIEPLKDYYNSDIYKKFILSHTKKDLT